MQTRAPAQRIQVLKPEAVKTGGGCGGRRNSQSHRRVPWRGPQNSRMYTSPSSQGSAPQGPDFFLWVVGEVTERGLRAKQAALLPLSPLA